MNENMTDLCQWVVEKAKTLGATDSKASLSKRRFVEINYLDKKPEVIKEATTQNLALEVFVGQKSCNQETPDLRKSALEAFIKKAIDNTQYMEEDPYGGLPDEGYFKPSMYKDLQLSDSQYAYYSPEKRHEISKMVESSCIEKGGDKVVSVEAGCYDDHYQSVMINSKGFIGENETSQYWVGATMTAKGKGHRKPAGYYWVGSRFMEDLPPVNEIGVTAAEKTLELLNAQKIATEQLPIIIENRHVGRVMGGLISAMNGRNIQQKSSFLIDKKGSKIGSDLLTLSDNPFKKRGIGSRLFDGDGLMAKEMQPFTNGVLNDYYINWYYSQKLNSKPTTGGPSNLSVPAGDKSVAELMKDLNRGFIINGFIGGNSNAATGDFSVGVTGHLFENGEKVQAIAEMNIADNHLTFWKKLIAVGNDPWLYGNWNIPSLVFEDVVVSGA